MINYVYQLIKPRTITVKYKNLATDSDRVIIRPEYMSICHADQRYYKGERDAAVLRKKLPMALIHEAMGRVVCDPTGTFKVGEKVVMIPNVPGTPVDKTYPNYLRDSKFCSSGYDGFMRELVDLPADRVVSCEGVDPTIAAISEFISVVFHAADRFERARQTNVGSIGVWGDGGLGYLVALVLKYLYPNAQLNVIGLDETKLSRFTFADKTYNSTALPEDFHVDHAFECCGGAGCYYAGNQIIDVINPQGTVVLMGVSEKEVPLNTRMVLERGLTLVGSSRSDRVDFENVVKFLRAPGMADRVSRIVTEVTEVKSITDIYDAFDLDLTNPFKTVIKWSI